MTNPILIQNPTIGEIINQAAAPLLQTLARKKQEQFQQQQLDMERQRFALAQQEEARQAAESQQLQQVRAFELSQAQKTAQAQLDASKGLQRLNELGFSQENVSKVLAETKNPDAITIMLPQIQQMGQSLASPATTERAASDATTAAVQAREAQADEPVVAAKRVLLQRSLDLASTFLDHPDRPLPSNPTQGQAVAAAVLDVTGLISNAMQELAQGRSANAQSDMLTRQLAMQAQASALQQIAKNHSDALDARTFAARVKSGEMESDDAVLERVAKSVGFENAAQLRELTREAYQRWTKARKLNQPELLTTDPRLDRFITGAGFRALNQDQKNLLIDTAMEAARTGRTPTTAPQGLAAAGFENPALWAKVLGSMITALKTPRR